MCLLSHSILGISCSSCAYQNYIKGLRVLGAYAHSTTEVVKDYRTRLVNQICLFFGPMVAPQDDVPFPFASQLVPLGNYYRSVLPIDDGKRACRIESQSPDSTVINLCLCKDEFDGSRERGPDICGRLLEDAVVLRVSVCFGCLDG